MAFEIPNFTPALPEIFVLTMICVVLVVDLFLTDKNRSITYLLSQATLLGAAVLTVVVQSSVPEYTFSGMFVNDSMGTVLKLFIYLSTSVVFIYSREYLIERNLFKGEFFVLTLFSVLGMMVMVSANNLLTIYLGLEVLSLAMYAMVALNRDSSISSEAAMKYFVLGAIASGMLLYGMSMLYGATGSLDHTEIASFVTQGSTDDIVLKFALVFIVIGLAFKLGAVPFHMWVPDVYQGAPTAITLFISSAPKIAAFAMLIRLLVEGLGGLLVHWQDMLIIIAVLSIIAGNVIAIAQKNLKRMLAYSTISHVGFLMLGILAGTSDGYSAGMFYVIVYALMSLAAFGMIILLSRSGFEADTLEDFKGLNQRSPWFAFMMLITMFSMAGVPPTVGFYAKLAVLSAVVEIGLVWLAVLAVVFSVIGAFYYLRVIKFMYFDKAVDTAPISSAYDMRAVMSANGMIILLLGIYPTGLIALCVSVMP
ncbi:NADH-ubiquinone oxidoreductase chain N [hydrothermal vent metagenome]|uniref:NADH-ubiquinone oxidoreductase chain N n=1 Tax=hydrothermal vent metagenome TaxID=652676 RepID=A0A3B0Z4R9_9ZZZZ